MKYVPIILAATKDEVVYKDIKVPIYFTGIGPVNAACTVSKLLRTLEEDWAVSDKIPILINVGTAGASTSSKSLLKTGDIVLPTSVASFGFEVSEFNFQPLVNNLEIAFEKSAIPSLFANPNFVKLKQGSSPDSLRILSSPFFVNSHNFREDHYSKIESTFKLFDMESYFINYLSRSHNFIFHSLKIVSDFADIQLNEWAARAAKLKASLTEATNQLVSDLSSYYKERD